MKIQFLGTAAAEGFPAVFCNCKYCENVRSLGKKYFRTRSQALIDGKLLIDMPPDTYYHFLQHNIRGDQIESVIFTHSHSDHFYFKELDMRGAGYGKNMQVNNLNVLVPNDGLKIINELGTHAKNTINVLTAVPYKTITLGDYQLAPLPARHGHGKISANIYLIKKGEKTFLYGHDTGYFYEEVFNYFKENEIYLNALTVDCCYGSLPISDEGGHMGIANNERLFNKLESLGVIDSKTVKIVNHFSHNVNPLQSVLEEECKNLNALVSYDGMTIEI